MKERRGRRSKKGSPEEPFDAPSQLMGVGRGGSCDGPDGGGRREDGEGGGASCLPTAQDGVVGRKKDRVRASVRAYLGWGDEGDCVALGFSLFAGRDDWIAALSAPRWGRRSRGNRERPAWPVRSWLESRGRGLRRADWSASPRALSTLTPA